MAARVEAAAKNHTYYGGDPKDASTAAWHSFQGTLIGCLDIVNRLFRGGLAQPWIRHSAHFSVDSYPNIHY
jgi:hypothetical protein